LRRAADRIEVRDTLAELMEKIERRNREAAKAKSGGKKDEA
jgi:hypothetical protein